MQKGFSPLSLLLVRSARPELWPFPQWNEDYSRIKKRRSKRALPDVGDAPF